jgi:hypothetical protein
MTPKEQLIYEIEQASDPIVEELLDFLLLAKIKHHRQQSQSFAAFIEELVADIPPQLLETLPTDSAVEHDHYLYGTPKRALHHE